MNANIFMFFDCFLVEDEEVLGSGMSSGRGWGIKGFDSCGEGGCSHQQMDTGIGVGNGWGDGYSWGSSNGNGHTTGSDWGEGFGSGRGYDNGNGSGSGSPQTVLCLVEIRRPSNER